MNDYPCLGKKSNSRWVLTAAVCLSLNAQAAVRYVNVNNLSPASPYTTWATAAAKIQDAIDAASAGDEIIVTNGVYLNGGRVMVGSMTNRVALNKAVNVHSVNGPEVTLIQGYQVPGATNGNGAVRCAYLTFGATLSGFTLTHGATRAAGSVDQEQSGGGVWCAAVPQGLPICLVSNCVLTGNSAYANGGGANSGTLDTCLVTNNSANDGGGTYSTTLKNCTLVGNQAAHLGGGANAGTLTGCTLTGNRAGQSGGGAYSATITNSVITSNASGTYGGGADSATLTNCTLTGNSALNGGGVCNSKVNNCTITGKSAIYGGGVFSATLNNCTLTGNSALGYGGGAYYSTLNNCLVYYNPAGTSQNWFAGTMNYCCTTPLPGSGTNNIDTEPQLASASHLSSASPCRGAGSAAFAKGKDLDGEAWANPPSIGCDELYAAGVTGALSVSIQADYTNVSAGFTANFTAVITGKLTASQWDFADGSTSSNRPYASHTWSTPGDYPVVLSAYNDSNPGGISATVVVHVVSQPVHYVAASSTTSTAPYTSWATAATKLQDSVDAATLAGALVLVDDGVYAAGGRAVSGALTNRVAITLPLVLQSVHGAEATFILGSQSPGTTNGDSAVRCVYLSSGSTLAGFTLTNGATRLAGDQLQEQSGGGLWCAPLSVVVSNCVIAGNAAAYGGGGAYCGSFFNCTLSGNSAVYGGGAYRGTLTRCTLTGNSAGSGGGAHACTLYNSLLMGNWASGNGGGLNSGAANNCTVTGNSAAGNGGGSYSGVLNNSIIYYNLATNAPNCSGGTLSYSCTTPLPAGGTGNIEAEPLLASVSHLSAASPCRAAGNPNYSAGTDIDGEPWANPPSMGCDEVYPGTATGPLSVSFVASYTNVIPGYVVSLTASIAGRPTASLWDFADGSRVSNRPYATHAWAALGDYPVIVRAYNDSYPGGISATAMVHVISQPVHYVSTGNAVAQAPYSSWATAAANIQDAVDVASVPGALVLVSNGVYSAGGRVVFGVLSNRVAVTLPLMLQSVNGPGVTRIQGYQMPGTTNGEQAVRCVYLASGATLAGFTLTNGATRAAGDLLQEQSGGGVWCAWGSSVVSNCVLSGNAAAINGGGAYSGTLLGCTLSGNFAPSGGGAYSCSLQGCNLTGNRALSGGGAYAGSLSNCTVMGGSALNGGGVYLGALSDCTLLSNSAVTNGGGACSANLSHCTVSGNSARFGGGNYAGTLTGCVVSSNSVSWQGGGANASTATNCTFIGNTSAGLGGGAYAGALYQCTLRANSAGDGGGAHSSKLDNCGLWGNSAFDEGGGANGCALNRCTVSSNTASYAGGGAYSGSLNSSVLTANSAALGGGSCSAVLTNCTSTGNWANNGGGDMSSTLNNCILYYNRASLRAPNYNGSSFSFSCTTPLPGGNGNIDSEPQLASASHVSLASPCRGRGNLAYAVGTDIDGELWAAPPSMGCDEPSFSTAVGALSVGIQAPYSNIAAGFPLGLTAVITGEATVSRWEFGDGTVISNWPYASHAWSAPGDYVVVLRAFNQSNPAGVSATVLIHVGAQPTHYVALDSAAPLAPYTSWSTAARNIQDAVDAATLPGARVLVTNGLYATGGRVVYGMMTNRVAVTQPLVLQSVNGPTFTVIQGYRVPGTTNGDSAIRCVSLTEGAALIGFTLTNGATRVAGDQGQERCGGGVWCASPLVTVSNCVIVGNAAYQGGGAYCGALSGCVLASNWTSQSAGGALGASLTNCTLEANTSVGYGGGASGCTLDHCLLRSNVLAGTSAGRYGGGADSCSLNDCTLAGNVSAVGGAAYNSTFERCTLTGNSASFWGGGTYACTLNNSLIASNSTGGIGGGAYFSTLNNCLLVGNLGADGGGAYQSTLNNCVVYYNAAPTGPNYSSCPLNYCCSYPMPDSGLGNITNAPMVVDLAMGNFHLQPNSPCINAGRNAYVLGTTDQDGQARIVGGTVDMGAYEFQTPASVISYAWLQQYGIPANGSADYADPDGDGLNNWQEWLAGTEPTNALSALRMLLSTRTGSTVAVAWTSVANKNYTLEWATNLAAVPAFSLWRSNIAGQAGTTSLFVTNAPGLSPCFYRVRVDR